MPTREEMIDAGWDTKELDDLLWKEGRMTDPIDPQSFCPWCKRTHDAPEFIEALKKISRLSADVDEYQQQQDEIIIALGSAGLLPSEIVDAVKRLSAENERQKHINTTHLEEHQRLVAENERLTDSMHRLQALAWKYKMERVSTEQKPKTLDESLREQINRGLYPDVSPNTAIEKDCSHTGDRVSKGGEEYCDDCGAALVGDRQ